MSYIYSATGSKIQLELSADDVGVRFEAAEDTTRALRAMRAGAAAPTGLAAPQGFHRVMLLHDPGAARSSFATVRAALPRREMNAVRRTLPVFKEPQSGLRMVATREIAVRFKPRVTPAQQARLLMSLKLTAMRDNEFEPHQRIVEPVEQIDETVILELANRLSEAPEVAFAAPNFVSEHRKDLTPNDPMLAQQWHLANPGTGGALAGEDVDALLAWDITPGGSTSVVIAIIDDGVDLAHPDLRDNIWVNPDPTAPDRNGRNFYDNDYDPRPRYFNPPYDLTDVNDIHGTPCAGVAAARGNNGAGVCGVAYNTRILAVKIFGADALASNEQVANAIRYAGRHAQVLSCSWGGAPNPDLESAITDVGTTGRGGRGCLVFCATGNESRALISHPARYEGAIAIGASNDRGRRSRYSNTGQGIDFVAPSSDNGRPGITTTDVTQANRGYNPSGAYTDTFGGTSSATPLAAGVGALLLSVRPTLTRDQAYAILRDTAEKLDATGGGYQRGFSLQYGYGRLNAHAAVARAQTARASRRRPRPASASAAPGASAKPAKPAAKSKRSAAKKGATK